MKYAVPGIIVFTFSFPALQPILIGEAGAQTSPSEKIRKPVIVELFTSEGCSTCPLADALLTRLEDQQTG
jgi:hypothetical protein